MFAKLVLAALSLVAATSAVTVDPAKWYTLSTGGSTYLDSTDSVLMPQSHTDRNALNSGNDKGVRFRFPDGLPGRVVCAAHNDHWVGIAQGDNVYLNQWSTNLDSDDWLGTAEAVGDGIELYYSDGYAGTNTIGTPVTQSEAVTWDVIEISAPQL
ncbi:uncharacterized protein STEHIDRAFT_147032 [Stereum hirsutum FP-91666 SS1]|uniref:uncharacterized protein n=1 Tax=Stereum hirsutum (strain FP-91666) TaxID=721885 RepID=UPI000440C8BA|nr:uncharacterized protein STEHIDRAFT_147032 [Stereum hirsutum FP-91666 SS1]EIM86407.1 hypothetical protein STEHIDRAFT_147032 [Stereum hirsutum FP-91666 SS1]